MESDAEATEPPGSPARVSVRSLQAGLRGQRVQARAWPAVSIRLTAVVALLESGKEYSDWMLSTFSSPFLKGREQPRSLKTDLGHLAKLLDFSLELFVGNIILKLDKCLSF